jgi:putative RecB family exonuclease
MSTEPVYAVPTSLSPSRVSAFTQCPLQFRFVNVQGLPSPPTIHTTRGTIVHRVLEILFANPPERRTRDDAHEAHRLAREEYTDHPDVTDLFLDETETTALWSDTADLVDAYLEMEDPSLVRPEGLELRLEVPLGEFVLRGIIDRLERDDEGRLVISDYKTGRSPSENQSAERMNPMMLYGWLCLRHFGEAPSTLRLYYLKDRKVLERSPSVTDLEFHAKRTTSVWKAIATACTTGKFQPRKSALCNFCEYRQWCPEFGGDPERAAAEAPLVVGRRPGS